MAATAMHFFDDGCLYSGSGKHPRYSDQSADKKDPGEFLLQGLIILSWPGIILFAPRGIIGC